MVAPRARARIGQDASLGGQSLGGAQLAGRNAAELIARGDVELQEDLAQVVLHRPGADEELCTDLRVGETISGQSSDVCLLRCEHGARLVGALPRCLTGGQELVTGALGKPLASDATEDFVRGPELLARVDPPVFAPQPFAIKEPRAGEVDHSGAACESLHRLAISG